jgi:hypothetical protein
MGLKIGMKRISGQLIYSQVTRNLLAWLISGRSMAAGF